MFEMLIHHLPRKVEDAVDQTLASDVIPQLRTLIEAAAKTVTSRPGFENSPYARDVAAERLIKELAGFLALTSFDDVETARLSMLRDECANWWCGLEGAE